jgi:hypothetical protein
MMISDSFAWTLIVAQIVLIIFYGVGATYSDDALPKAAGATGLEAPIEPYGLFQDVHVMIFIGFGFLMTFLAR